MTEKEDEKKTETDTDRSLEQLREEIARKGTEIEQLKKTIEDMRKQIQAREESGANKKLDKVVGEVSGLLDAGFSILGTSSKVVEGKSVGQGLFGLINDLAALAEKSGTYQRRVDLGKRGVVDFRVSSRPIRKSYSAEPKSPLSISKSKKAVSVSLPQEPPTARIKEREPFVDIFEEEDHIAVMVELPGVEENEVNLVTDEEALTVSTDTPDRKYCKRIELPARIKKDAVESGYRNGILEVKLRKLDNTERKKDE